VDVEGSVVSVDVTVGTSVVACVGVDSIAGLPPQLVRSKILRQIEKIRINNSQISNYESPVTFTSPLAAERIAITIRLMPVQ